MKSIGPDSSFWVKVEKTFIILFIGSNRMIVCLQSSQQTESFFVRSDVYFFVHNFAILLQ